METQPLPVGTTLKGKYSVTQLVAGGGMAWVYRAEERQPGGTTRVWAIKELRPISEDPTAQAEAHRLFEQEARILSRLRHRIRVGRIVLEFVAG